MAAREVKTRENDGDVTAFLDAVEHPVRRRDARTLCQILERVTGTAPRMWGTSIVGFGRHEYRYASGRSGVTCALGFSPRREATTVYLLEGSAAHAATLSRLGPHRTGRGCLYLKDLELVDLVVLAQLLEDSWLSVTRARSAPSPSER